MVERKPIGVSDIERLVQLVKGSRDGSNAGHTSPAGNKVLEGTENVFWGGYDRFGAPKNFTIRDVAGELEDAQGRIDEAKGALEDTQVRLDDAENIVGQVDQRLDTVETETIPNAVSQLEAADTAAQQEFADLDDRLANFATDEALGPLRQALTDAQSAVEAAQSTADAAVTAANSANQAALQAAGIADAKGKVIFSEDEPTGDDQSASNLWIQPSTETTHVWNGSTWEPITSDLLDQAAQNAIDAQNTANQAKQTAETAIANAATAQAAAEAAQTTANQATLDAADAHNAAVEAQDKVDAAIESGDSLLINGSFESGALGWPAYIGDNTHSRAGIAEDPDARTGTHTLRLTPVDANIYPESEPRLAVTPGQVLNFRGWWKHLGGDGVQTRMLVRTHDAANDYVAIRYPSARTDVQDWPIGEWVLQEGDYVVEEGIRFLSFAAHATGASTSEYRVDDLQVIDVTDARAAQARADEAYDEAASKLDEAEVDSKILASANGKNSVTISANEPSGSGVRPGDTWWRSDGAGQIFGQWVWNGDVWSARTIRSEVIANLDVNKLVVAGTAKMADVVIDKLWADGIAARALTAGSVTVAPGNMISWTPRASGSGDISPHNAYTSNAEYIRWGYDPDMGGEVLVVNMAAGGNTSSRFFMQLHPDRQVTDLVTEFGGNPFPVRGGTSYRIEFGLGAGGNYPDGRVIPRASFYVYNHAGERIGIISSGDLARPNGGLDPLFTNPQRHGATVDLPDDAAFVTIFLSASGSGFLYMFEPEFRPLVGAVQISDGAITTPKLTVTEDMSASIVNAMSVAAKKLVVSEEAILNHATLIGQTVVDDINVQGKLIGSNGVFTGTVDFANINVTGSALVSELIGETITGVTVTGSSVRTAIMDGNYAELTGDARWSRPGLAFRLSGFAEPASLTVRAPTPDSAGDTLSGSVTMSSAWDGSSSSLIGHVSAAPHKAWLQAGGYYISAGPNKAGMQSAQSASVDDGNLAFVEVRSNEAVVGYRTDYDLGQGGVRQRILVADAESVKLKAWTNGPDGATNFYRAHDLFALVEPEWTPLGLWSGYIEENSGPPLSAVKQGNRVHLRGRVARSSGSFQVGTAYTLTAMSESWRPEYTERQLVATGSSSGTGRIEVSYSSGEISFSPISGSASWIDFSGVWYDLPNA